MTPAALDRPPLPERIIRLCQIMDAAIAMRLSACPPPDTEALRRVQAKMRAMARDLRGDPAR